MDLMNKNILLTGATGGIGRVTAQLLAEQGARLILVARSQQRLVELKKSLPQAERHRIYDVDLSKDADLQYLNDCVKEMDCKIDVVINNAGINQFEFLANRTITSIKQELQINLQTPILLTKLALTWINQPGIILNIGSTFGAIGFPGYSVYCASKAGVYRFSEALNRELIGTGIRVLHLAPRATDTGLNSSAVKKMNDALGSKSDAPEFVAGAILRTLRQEKSSRWLGWPEKLFVRINQILPGLVSHFIGKNQEIISHYSQLQHHNGKESL